MFLASNELPFAGARSLSQSSKAENTEVQSLLPQLTPEVTGSMLGEQASSTKTIRGL